MEVLCNDSAPSPEIDGGAGWTAYSARLDFDQLFPSYRPQYAFRPKSLAGALAGFATGVSISASFLWLLSLDEQRK
jgi:hypothetical protein